KLNINPIDDIALMAYILNSAGGKSDMRVLIDTNLDEDIESNGFGMAFEEVGKGKTPEIFADKDQKREFYSFKNYAIVQLYRLLKGDIFNKKLSFVYHRFDNPLIPILADMEMTGIAIDVMKLKELSEEFDLKAKKLAVEIYGLAGEEFNIGSPKQLSEILFEKLSLKAGKKSKTGAYSTDSKILEELDLEGQVIAGKILEWRHISKLKSTYSDALQKEVNPQTKRIHTTFSNISTSTGRLSSNNPNLQNIPIRSQDGLKIRNAFIAKKGHKLLSADYSQIELRVLAHMADIAVLKKAFMEDKDIHAITAAGVFSVDEADVDSDMRRKAKAINFGIVYGISAFGLAKQLRIPRGDAEKYIDTYFATYPGIGAYMDKYQDLARQQGFVTTITGRKCFLPDINSKNPMVKGLAERLAINAPIQGSAADIVKKAMIDLYPALGQQGLQSKMILQVHDELILETPESEVEAATVLLKSVMENAFLLDLPLKVDVKVNDYWK
ncbi:MAG: DNA polymerase I, partial [Proteobacteria bacterium]|nr:DNA polymerase I [Pseudomonadota bacterium]